MLQCCGLMGKKSVQTQEQCQQNEEEHYTLEDYTPWQNSLVLSRIFSYLSFHDLKQCRLVSKLWEEETRTLLENRGKVYLYLHPEKYNFRYPNVPRYLREVKYLRMKTLHLHFPQTLKKSLYYYFKNLVNSPNHEFYCLKVTLNIERSSDFELFSMLLSSLELDELDFEGELKCQIEEEAFPQPVKRLKKFSHKLFRRRDYYDKFDHYMTKWIAFLSPYLREVEAICLGSEILFKFYFSNDGFVLMSKLKEVYLHFYNYPVYFSRLTCLTKLKSKLTVFDTVANEVFKMPYFIHRCISFGNPDSQDLFNLHEILFFHAEVLEILKIELHSCEISDIIFPFCPNLKELWLIYDENIRIRFGNSFEILNYNKFFPSLRKLVVIPTWFVQSGSCCPEWEKLQFDFHLVTSKEGLFHTFFPADCGMVCKSVRELSDPVCYFGQVHLQAEFDTIVGRLKEVAEMFPNVKNEKWEGIRNYDYTESGWSKLCSVLYKFDDVELGSLQVVGELSEGESSE